MSEQFFAYMMHKQVTRVKIVNLMVKMCYSAHAVISEEIHPNEIQN